MAKVSRLGHHHRHATSVARGHHLGVTDGATGLEKYAEASVGDDLESVGEGQKSV